MITEKRCAMCGITKPIDEFTLSMTRKDGHYCYCKTCSREQVKRSSLKLKTKNIIIRDNSLSKQCSKCGQTKSITEFRVNCQRNDGHNSFCKQCAQEIYRLKVKNMTDEVLAEIAIESLTKQCISCGLVKPIDEFPICREHKDGRKSLCVTCYRKRNHTYYNNTKEYRENYRESHSGKYSEYNRQLSEEVKLEVTTYYGDGKSSCVLCGESRLPCLSIDHINGGGTRHRRSLKISGGGGYTFYKWLKNEGYPSGYRTLCMNCQYLVEYEKRKRAYGERHLTNNK